MKYFIMAFILTTSLSGCDIVSPPSGVYLKVHNQEAVTVLVKDGRAVQRFILEPDEIQELEITPPTIDVSGQPDPYLDGITLIATEIPLLEGCEPRVDEYRVRFPRRPGEWDSKFWRIRLSGQSCS